MSKKMTTTTFHLDSELLTEIKIHAMRQGKSMGELLRELIKKELKGKPLKQ